MRAFHMTMAAFAGLSIAAPASAQMVHEPTYNQVPTAPTGWGHSRTYSQQLLRQIEAGLSQGTISQVDGIGLRKDLGRLVRLERRFSPNGISGREHAQLKKLSTALAADIRSASRKHSARPTNTSAWESGWVNEYWVADARFAGLRPGDRFNGDARVGQRAPARIVSLPEKYRTQFIDDGRIYYGFDDGRVYQIDRQSRVILALLDLARP